MEVQQVYNLSMECSQKIWDLVTGWPIFVKDTIGKQLVRSSDSVSANLREGQGRYSFKDRNLFNIYARGSLFETQCWIQKSLDRKMITREEYEALTKTFSVLHLEINKMIKNTRDQTFSK